MAARLGYQGMSSHLVLWSLKFQDFSLALLVLMNIYDSYMYVLFDIFDQ